MGKVARSSYTSRGSWMGKVARSSIYIERELDGESGNK